jgi:Zn-dependent protease/CBS domain-containing protein
MVMARTSAWRSRAPELTLFSVGRIPLRVDSSWLLIFFVVAWSAAAYFPRVVPGQLNPGAALALGLVASLFLFASILAHELSHSLVARALGYQVRSITLFIFGGVSEIEGEPRTARDEGAIALAGPLLSFVLAGLFELPAVLSAPSGVGHAFFAYLAAANVAIAIFNLFPGFPLDGGRVLRAAFRWFGLTLVDATRLVTLAGRLLGLAMIGLGAGLIFLGGFLPGIWLGLIGWFIKSSADASYEEVAFRAQAEEVHVGEVAERLVPLSPGTSVARALLEHGLQGYGSGLYPVVDSGRLTGVVSVEALRALPRERWSGTTVGELLDARGPVASIGPGTTLLEALEVMTKAGSSELPVTTENGLYLGILRLDDVARLAQLVRRGS